MASLLEKIVGHEQQKKSLALALQNQRLAPVLLFVGPSGVGKKQVAWGLAQLILCEKNSACGVCGACLRVSKKQSESLLWIEPTTTQIKVEDAKRILEFVSLRAIGKARVILIDEAHLLNPATGNSLLKTLEEPPPNTYFILIASGSRDVLPTIRSRSQIVQFESLSAEQLRKISQADEWILKASQGRMDLLEILNDPEKKEDRQLIAKFLRFLKEGDRLSAFSGLKETFTDRERSLFLIQILQQLLRDFIVTNVDSTQVLHTDLVEDLKEFSSVNTSTLNHILQNAFQLESEIVANTDRILAIEDFWLRARQALTESAYVA